MKILILLLLALLPGLSLAWPPRSYFPSPDGRFEAVIVNDLTLEIHLAATGEMLLQTNPSAPNDGLFYNNSHLLWSPDSRILAATATIQKSELTHLFLLSGDRNFEEIECPPPEDEPGQFWLIPCAWHAGHRLTLNAQYSTGGKARGGLTTGIVEIQIDPVSRKAKLLSTKDHYTPADFNEEDEPIEPILSQLAASPTFNVSTWSSGAVEPPWLDAGEGSAGIDLQIQPHFRRDRSSEVPLIETYNTEDFSITLGPAPHGGFLLSDDRAALACDIRHGTLDHCIKAVVVSPDRHLHQYSSLNILAQNQIARSKAGRQLFNGPPGLSYWSVDRITTRSITLLTPVTQPSDHTPKILRCVLLLKPGGKAELDSWDLHDP